VNREQLALGQTTDWHRFNHCARSAGPASISTNRLLRPAIRATARSAIPRLGIACSPRWISAHPMCKAQLGDRRCGASRKAAQGLSSSAHGHKGRLGIILALPIPAIKRGQHTGLRAIASSQVLRHTGAGVKDTCKATNWPDSNRQSEPCLGMKSTRAGKFRKRQSFQPSRRPHKYSPRRRQNQLSGMTVHSSRASGHHSLALLHPRPDRG